MTQLTAAGEAIKAERERRGWSVYRLSQETEGAVHTGSIFALEKGADPTKVSAVVMIELIRALWPKLQLVHFSRRKDLKVAAVDKRADRRLRGLP